jgi:urate oxidase
MARLGENRWGKSDVRVSKILRTGAEDDFLDLNVQILLQGDVEAAHVRGDNAGVLPTDTMKNTVYGLAQEHLTRDLEAFAAVLCDHFLGREGISGADVSVSERLWDRMTPSGFLGGGSGRRLARVAVSPKGGDADGVWAGVDGLVVLKTTGSASRASPGMSSPCWQRPTSGSWPRRSRQSGDTRRRRQTQLPPGRRRVRP